MIRHRYTEKALALGIHFVIQKNYKDGDTEFVYYYQIPAGMYSQWRDFSRPIVAFWRVKACEKYFH
jgi:hypothetical protein